MAKKKKKSKKSKGLSADNVEALQKFCNKHGVKFKGGDDFVLTDFLLEVTKATLSVIPTMLEIERKVGALVEKEGEESENFGGSPCGGSRVTLDVDEDPYTGYDLSTSGDDEDEDEDEESDDQEDEDTEADEDEDEDEDGDEDEDSDEDSDEDEDEDEDGDDDDTTDDELEDEDSDEDEDEDSDESDEDEDSDESDEDGDEDEDEDGDEDSDEDESEPVASPTKKRSKSKGKKGKNREAKEAERVKKRAVFEKNLEKYAKKPKLLGKIAYSDLLMISGLLGSERPMKIGNAEAQRVWIEKKLRAKFGKKKKGKGKKTGKDKKKKKSRK